VTIPTRIRKKYNLKRGSQVEFIETEHGVLLIPVPNLAGLRGVDKDRKQVIYQMIRELQTERRKEAARGE
jgi:AbrB family looped-hinge helix DNA binding protein